MGPGSTISETDVRHFKAVANPEHIDQYAVVEPTPSSSHPKMDPPRPQTGTDKFILAAQQRGATSLPRITEGGTEYDSSSSSGEDISNRFSGRAKATPKKEEKNDKPTEKKYMSDSDSYDDYSTSGDDTAASARRKAVSRVSSNDNTSSVVPTEAPPIQYDRPSKQDMLYELDRMVETHNVKLSKHFSMSDHIDDIERELNMHRQQVSDASMIVIMREGLLALTAGIEMANSRVGVLSLDGWSNEVSADSRRYDPTLVRLKQKYMRTSVLQPEAELAFLLGSSAISYHIKSRNKKVENAERREKRRKNKKNVEETDDEEEEELPSTFTETTTPPA